MLILACIVLAAAIVTAVEIDRELGGRWRVCTITLVVMWLLMFVAAVDSPDATAGFAGYMLTVITAAQAALYIGVLVSKARRRWATWHNV